jgi:N-acetylmuramic acid 6-phosphate etherase
MSKAKVLPTETVNPQYQDLDTWDTGRVVQALADDQLGAIEAVRRAVSRIAQAADLAVERLRRGGRLIYAGAGTSGRLGFLDSAELPPTFSWPPERSLVCIAGGEGAIRRAAEGAEDDLEAGKRDFLAHHPTPEDVVIALAASGTTPYPQGVLLAAREMGALRVGIANNPHTPVLQLSEVPIALETGPEVISGSTRLKAGTAQKIALNTLSSAIMVRLGKVYGNLMVDMQATNTKLVQRAIRLTQMATGASEEEAKAALEACGWRVKTAIVMLKKNLGAGGAQTLLDSVEGSVRRALG